ncbi:MAG: hypothetical protein QOJ90_643 [Actinomycetota bacterium]|jgi:hypothetical protein|nr:hypothetical protein [Actinomycetota bacterium]MDQ1641292.1 hypothetical protein [Actinomycetota bacterium]
MSSRKIIGALAALLVAGLAIAVPSLAATGKSDPKTPPSQSSSQQAATAKAKADQAAADKAKAEQAAAAKAQKTCPPQSSNGQGGAHANPNGANNGCGNATYPPAALGH